MLENKRLFGLTPIALAVMLAMTGCGGNATVTDDSSSGGDTGGTPTDTGGGITTTPTVETQSISGGGIKGPLAYAIVKVYAVDTTQVGFKGAEVATATTNAQAAITGLELPKPFTPPYIIEFTSDASTVDITTNAAPVIVTLRSVITQEMLDSGNAIYATPLTNMAVDLAVKNTSENVGGSAVGDGSAADFLTQLPQAAEQVTSTLGFGMGEDVDIFATPPLIDESSDTQDEQANVVAYRAAVEALTAVVFNMREEASRVQGDQTLDTSDMLGALVNDLSDGEIDGQEDGQAIEAMVSEALDVLDIDPTNLPIPGVFDASGDPITVGDIKDVLVSEQQRTGSTTNTNVIANIQTRIEIAQKDPDWDDDGHPNVRDAFPKDGTEWEDTDNDGEGNNADSDDDNDGVADEWDAFDTNPFEYQDTDGDGLGNFADRDDDNDTVLDVDDDYPLDETRFSKTDQDSDGWPSHLDADDSDSSVPGISWQDTDNDGIPDENSGGLADDDDDNDGVPDDQDAFPLNGQEQIDSDGDGVGDHEDTDDDGDGVDDADDLFPLDETESSDHDWDGIGDNADDDDDNDGALDVDELAGCELKRDCDADGRPDGKDEFPENPEEWKDLDKDGVGDNEDTDDDNDGLSDEAEKEWGSNPYDADSDGDGTADGSDAFPRDEHEHADTDKDGIGDKADLFPEDAEETGDKDGDGIGDNSDVFPLNPEETTDTDQDGIGDNADNCALTANPDQADANGNGIGDVCEVTEDTADMSGVWQYTMNQVSTTCLAEEGDTDSEGPETGFISIVQEGNALDMLPVEAGFNIPGQVDGDTFSFVTVQSDEDPFSGEVRTETVEGTAGQFTDVAEGNDTFTVNLNLGRADCSTTHTMNGERVYQHTGSEDYSSIYKVEMSFEEEDLTVQPDGTSHHESHHNQEAFPIEIVQTGTQLDIFSGEGKFAMTSIDPESGRFVVEFSESEVNDFGGVEIEDFKLKGLFIAAPDAAGPVLVFSEESFETETEGVETGEPTVGPEAVDNIQRKSFERGFAYGKPATTSSFTTLVKSADGESVYVGVANPPMSYQGEEGGLKMEVQSPTGESICTNYFEGGFKEITKLDHPENFGQFRSGAYATIACDVSQAGQTDVAAGTAYSVGIVDSTGTAVFTTEEVVAVTTAPTDLISEVKLNGHVLPMPTGTAGSLGGSYLPGFYNLSDGFNLEWTAPTDQDGFTGYQVRLHENDHYSYDDVITEVRRVTTATTAQFGPQDFNAYSGVKFQIRTVYEKPDGKTHGLTPKWTVSSGINGMFDLAFDDGEALKLEISGQDWGIQHCFAFNETAQFECRGEGVDLENATSNITLPPVGEPERHLTLHFLNSTSGEILQGDAVVGQFTLSEDSSITPPPGPVDPVDPTNPGTPVAPLPFEGTDVTNMAAVLAEGFHWLDAWQYEEFNSDGTSYPVTEVEYGSVNYDATSTILNISDYEWDFDASTWTLITEDDDPDVLLGASGWEAVTLVENLTLVDDMTIQFQSINSVGDVFEDMTVTAQEMDIAGESIASALHGEFQTQVGDEVFPAGSKAYMMAMTVNSELYKLDCWEGGQCQYAMMQQFDASGNHLGEDAITSLDGLLATSADDAMSKSQHIGHDGDAGLSLVLFGSLTQGQGVASIYKSSHEGAAPSEERNDLQWELRTVSGVELLLVNIPTDYVVEDLRNPAVIFSVYNGNVVRGEYTPAGVSVEEKGFNFNSPAINAILNAADMPME